MANTDKGHYILVDDAMTSLLEKAVKTAGPDAVLGALSEPEKAALRYIWRLQARENQLPPPGEWLTWMVMAGRGYGKTRTGAEWIRARVESGDAQRIALVGRTPADARDVMVEGESGILAVFPEHQKPVYEPSKRRITFHTGAVATVYSSETPGQLNGPQHDTMWWDELAIFNTAEAWDTGQFGIRLGRPRQIVTTTPRPKRVIRDLLADSDTIVTRGTSYENRANLAPAFFRQVIARYEGTRRGQQEIMGLLLEDVPGALWQRSMIQYKAAPEMERIVVGIDPSVSDSEDAARCGIVAAGKGLDGVYYVLADRSLRASPDRWAHEAISLFHELKADRIIAEVNQGGKMVELTLRTIDPQIPYSAVHASVGKKARAEPVSALYEQKKVFHVGPFRDLEDELCTWTPEEGPSPDRLDAMVWALTELALSRQWRMRPV